METVFEVVNLLIIGFCISFCNLSGWNLRSPGEVSKMNTIKYEDLAQFKKIVGGCVFGNRSALVIVGQEKDKRPSLDKYPMRVLQYEETSGIEDLILKAMDLQIFFGCDHWLSDTENQVVNQILDKINQERPGKDFFFQGAPFLSLSNAFALYVNSIKRLLHPAKKLLILGDSGLAAHLRALPEDAVFRGKVEDYPAISALGMVVTQLMEPDFKEQWAQKTAITGDEEEEVNPWPKRFGSAPRQ